MRPADLKYYTKTRDFTDVYVVGGKTAYQKPKVACCELPPPLDALWAPYMHLCLAPLGAPQHPWQAQQGRRPEF